MKIRTFGAILLLEVAEDEGDVWAVLEGWEADFDNGGAESDEE